jgi:methionine synthase II (cobalamin-independent)
MMNPTSAVDLRSMRVDLVGSLLRPQTLKDAFAKYDEGSAREVDLKDAVRRLCRIR